MQGKDMKSELIFHHIILVFHMYACCSVSSRLHVCPKDLCEKNRGKYLEIIKVHV